MKIKAQDSVDTSTLHLDLANGSWASNAIPIPLFWSKLQHCGLEFFEVCQHPRDSSWCPVRLPHISSWILSWFAADVAVADH